MTILPLKMKRSRILFALLSIPLDALIVFWAFFLARSIRNVTDLIPWITLPIQTISDASLQKFAIAGSLLFIIIQAFRWLYRIDQDFRMSEIIGQTFVSSFVWFFCYIALLYLGNEYLYHTEIPRLIVFFTWWISMIGIWVERFILRKIWLFLYRKDILTRHSIFLYWDPTHPIYQAFKDTSAYKILTGNTEQLISTIRKRWVDEVMILWVQKDQEWLKSLIELARIYGIRIRLSDGIDQWILKHATLDFLWEYPMLSFHFIWLSSWGRVMKRCFDLIFSTLFIIVLLPFGIIVALIIFLQDWGFPIYSSIRVGKDGKKFRMYKFRSMKIGAEREKKELLAQNERNGPLFKIANDPRITPFGRFIRSYDIDELPQLLNVFIGNMSLVGPRPHIEEEVAQYKESDHQLLTLKPWITWMAQTHGRHRNTFEQEVILDTYYIEHWSLSLDVRICLRTIFVIVGGESV